MADPNTPDTDKKTSGKIVIAAIVVVLIAVGVWVFGTNSFRLQQDATPADAAATQTETPAPEAASGHEGHAHNDMPKIEKVGNPADIDGIKVNGLVLGNDDAPVKVTEYFSYSCVHCAHFHAGTFSPIKDKFIKTGRVQYEFRSFPLNNAAINAALLTECLPAERQYQFLTLLLETQEHWAFTADPVKPLSQYAQIAGLSADKITACLEDKTAIEAMVTKAKAESDRMKIQSTPTFIFNNDAAQKLVGALGLSAFEAKVVELEGGAPATAPDAPKAAPDAAAPETAPTAATPESTTTTTP